MFDQFNISINLVMALLLSVSPHFFEKYGTTPENVRAIYAEAQKRAEYIIKTGDTAELAKIQDALSQLKDYDAEINTLMPLLHQLGGKLAAQGVNFALPAETQE